ncbi:MAG: NAD(P)-dependent oxidoreductase [Anaerolineales bacterium]|nr:NAD(P)-dependent oxidoreductase [Anaerolineales bacterium]
MDSKKVLWKSDETCLVTGGCGFIGSHLVRELADQGRNVIAYDFNPDVSYLADCLDKVKFVYGDVANMAHLMGVMADYKVNVVFHLGYMLVPDTDNRTGRAIQVNCAGFQNVMEAARILKIRRVVWASSQAVYGFAEGYPVTPISEDVHVNPTTQYGACKLFNEHVARYYWQQHGVDNIGLRKPVVYGLGKSRRRDLSISHRLIENAIVGRPVEVPPADFHANYVYVKDIVRAYIFAMQAPPTKHIIFNINGYAYRCSEVVEILRGLFPDLLVSNVKSLDTPNPIDAYDLSPIRAREELGYEPAYALADGVRDFLNARKELGHMYTSSSYDYDVTPL